MYRTRLRAEEGVTEPAYEDEGPTKIVSIPPTFDFPTVVRDADTYSTRPTATGGHGNFRADAELGRGKWTTVDPAKRKGPKRPPKTPATVATEEDDDGDDDLEGEYQDEEGVGGDPATVSGTVQAGAARSGGDQLHPDDSSSAQRIGGTADPSATAPPADPLAPPVSLSSKARGKKKETDEERAERKEAERVLQEREEAEQREEDEIDKQDIDEGDVTDSEAERRREGIRASRLLAAKLAQEEDSEMQDVTTDNIPPAYIDSPLTGSAPSQHPGTTPERSELEEAAAKKARKAESSRKGVETRRRKAAEAALAAGLPPPVKRAPKRTRDALAATSPKSKPPPKKPRTSKGSKRQQPKPSSEEDGGDADKEDHEPTF